MLRFLPPSLTDNAVLSGLYEDAAAFRLTPDGPAVLATVDVITPVVDDPYMFGAVAAANAFSDVYAMGGTPLFALNIAGFPTKALPLETLGQILRGATEKAAEAGAAVLGGHSFDDHAPKFGMAVVGTIDPGRIVRKAGVQAGDALVLTKPLGIGVITTAIDQGIAGDAAIEQALQVMTRLNRDAAQAMTRVGVHAATDVTGFGLLGHLREMLQASGLAATISLERVPVLEPAWHLIERGAVSGGTRNNLRYLHPSVSFATDISEAEQIALCDAQTSGGLLIAVPPERQAALLAALRDAGCLAAAVIGTAVAGEPGRIEVRRG